MVLVRHLHRRSFAAARGHRNPSSWAVDNGEVRWERIRAGQPISRDLVGAVLTRDLLVGGERWSKGRRLSAEDLAALEREPAKARGMFGPEEQSAAPGAVPSPAGAGAHAHAPSPPAETHGERRIAEVTLLIPEPTDIHENDAAVRLAAALAGPGVTLRGPVESRIDLIAGHDGVLRVDVAGLERLNRIDPLSVFSAYDGQVIAAGQVVASVKVGPHLVAEHVIEAGEAVARSRPHPIVDVRPFERRRVAALVRETLGTAARSRFEASVRARVERLGSKLTEISYVPDDADAIAERLDRLSAGSPGANIVLTAGAASTDPADAVFVALERLGGRVVSHGVPAHPGSMLWLARLRRTTIIGLPTCGAYSKATAVDLLLPWLLSGDRPTRATVARLGHGGLLTRDMRFRMPAYARELEAPEG